MKTVWFDGFSSSNKQRKKNRLKCKRGLLNDGTKDWEKKTIYYHSMGFGILLMQDGRKNWLKQTTKWNFKTYCTFTTIKDTIPVFHLLNKLIQ